jgi:hypothetical protein
VITGNEDAVNIKNVNVLLKESSPDLRWFLLNWENAIYPEELSETLKIAKERFKNMIAFSIKLTSQEIKELPNVIKEWPELEMFGILCDLAYDISDTLIEIGEIMPTSLYRLGLVQGLKLTRDAFEKFVGIARSRLQHPLEVHMQSIMDVEIRDFIQAEVKRGGMQMLEGSVIRILRH